MLRELLILNHSHTDVGYTHEQPIVWELHRQFIDDALEQIDRTADWDADSRPIWTCEVTEMLRHWKKRATPQQIARFDAAVAAGRMGAAAMAWNWTPMVGVRQFLHSMESLPELRRTHGLSLDVAINHDVNGLPWTMVPLLLDAGVKMLTMGVNVHFGGFPLHRPLFFKWVGPDGRSILTFNGEQYGMFQRYARIPEQSIDAMAEGIQAYQDKLAAQNYPHDFAVLSLTHPLLVDNNGTYPVAYDMIRRWNAEGRTPRLRFITPEDLLARAQSVDLPEYRGDWTDYWNFGTASSAHETRIAHDARGALFGADLLALQGAPSRDAALAEVTREAYDELNLWDEHTWGSYTAIAAPNRDVALAGWHLKAHPAYRAHALARYVRTERLEALAGNPRHAERTQGVLLFNPTPFERVDYASVPNELLDGRYDHVAATVHRFLVGGAAENMVALTSGRSLSADSVFGPFTVPAYGWLRLPISALTTTAADGLETGEDFLSSPTHALRFDARTGALLSLRDKRSGREFADASSPWPLLGLVHETVDGPTNTPVQGRELLLELDYDKFQQTSFRSGWPARRTGESVVSVRTLREAHRVGLEVRSTLPGADDVTRTIWLYAHHSRIGIDVAFRKQHVEAPDALYLALPLALSGWDMTFDTMGTPTRFDAEQLAGSCRDWVTVSGYAAVHTADAGVTLACPDAPLVMPGGFVFGERRMQVPRDGNALLLAWLTNNYWTTNFRIAQPGPLKFHYELDTHGAFDPIHAARVAAFARGGFVAHPAVHAERIDSGAILHHDDGVVVSAVSPDGRIHLQNLTDAERAVTVHTPRGPRSARVPARGFAQVE
jgi:hypothetical protein